MPYSSKLRQHLHGTGSVWNRYEISTDRPCVYTGPAGSDTDRICYLVPKRSTYEGDPIWNRTFPVLKRSRVNRVDPYHSVSDLKWLGKLATIELMSHEINAVRSKTC